MKPQQEIYYKNPVILNLAIGNLKKYKKILLLHLLFCFIYKEILY